MRHVHVVILLAILAGSFLVRLYKIDSPVADWHSWRQADTVAVSRNFIKYGFDLLHPRYDDISSTQSGTFNPKGLRLVEFPLYNAIVAVFFSLFGVHEAYARLVSVVSSLVTLVCIYVLVATRLGKPTGLLASFLFGFLPYNVYFSRAIFPENFALALAMVSLVFADRFARKPSRILWLASAGFASLALLAKLTVAFNLIPLFYLVWSAKGRGALRSLLVWGAFLITIVPVVLWRWWISQFPEGIPANTWLLNGGNIRFKGAWFRWIFAERLSKYTLGYGGLPLFVIGLILKLRPQEGWLFVCMIVGSLLYVTVFARGNIQHDYYQILVIPSLVIMAAKGAQFLLDPGPHFQKAVTIPTLFMLVLAMFAFGWYEVRGNYQINHPEIIAAGRFVDKIARKDALVIAPYDGDTAFLYQTNRAGWPIFEGTIEELIVKGADIYVSVRFDEATEDLATQFATLARTPEFVVLDLQKPL